MSVKMKLIFWQFFLLFLLFNEVSPCQPYYYYLKYQDSLYANADIYRYDLKTGINGIFFSDLQKVNDLRANNEGWLFFQQRFQLNAISLSDTSQIFSIYDNIQWVNEIIVLTDINRLYINFVSSITGEDSSLVLELSNFKFKYYIDQSVNIFNYESFASNNDSIIYFPTYDSLADQKYLTKYDILSNTILSSFSLSSIGPNTNLKIVEDGKNDEVLVSYNYPNNSREDNHFIVFNFTNQTNFPTVSFPYRSKGYLSSNGKYMILEEVDFDTTKPTVEYRPGHVAIFLTSTGALIKDFDFPPLGRVLLFNNYPDNVYYVNESLDSITNVITVNIDSMLNENSSSLFVKLTNSNGNLLTGGSLQYYEGTWKDAVSYGNGIFGVNTDRSTISLSMTYEGASQTIHNIPVGNDTAVFQTVNISVQLQNSQGNLIDEGTVQYYAGSWRDFGTTVNGTVQKELLPKEYSFSMTYEGASISKQQDIGTNPTVVFQTINVTVQFQNSQGNLIDEGTVQYYSGSWRNLGTTVNGIAQKELLPKSYSFSMAYEGVSVSKQQNIASNSAVIFSTVLCTVKVGDSQSQPIDGAEVSYYSGSWREIGQTVNGQVTKEMLPKDLTFKAEYNGTSENKTQDISDNSIVEIILP